MQPFKSFLNKDKIDVTAHKCQCLFYFQYASTLTLSFKIKLYVHI